MELKEIEPRNLTDKIVESMSEVEAEAYVEPKYTYSPETEVEIITSVVPIPKAEAEFLLEPKPINRPISARDSESVYENPYSKHVYHNYGGTRISFQNFRNDQSRSKKWMLSCQIIATLVGIVIGGTVTGILMYFTKKTGDTLPPASTNTTATLSNSIEFYGELNSQFLLNIHYM